MSVKWKVSLRRITKGLPVPQGARTVFGLTSGWRAKLVADLCVYTDDSVTCSTRTTYRPGVDEVMFEVRMNVCRSRIYVSVSRCPTLHSSSGLLMMSPFTRGYM